jgi:succinate dehydrogenase/fumarate reductase flavoprotein subunit
MGSMPDLHIVIVGGGIAGLATVSCSRNGYFKRLPLTHFRPLL